MKNTMLVAVMAAMLVALAAVILTSTPSRTGLPGYVLTHPKIQEAYEFAIAEPEALDGVNCYCGCMHHPHDGRIHTRGLLDCYRNGDAFDRHASQCDMCINDALELKKYTEQGLSKQDIKNKIDSKYA